MSIYIIINRCCPLFYPLGEPVALYLQSFNTHNGPARYTIVNLCAHSIVRVRIWAYVSLASEPIAFLYFHTVFKGRVGSLCSFPPHFVAGAKEYNYAVPGNTLVCHFLMVCQAQPGESWVRCSLGVLLSFLCRTQWNISVVFITQLLFIEAYLTNSEFKAKKYFLSPE